MKKTLNIKLLVLLLTGVVNFCLSCKKMIDIKPEDSLDYSQTYRNVADADAAVIGVYGKLMNLAKQYVILNELRGDLVDVTANADPYLRQINNFDVSEDNPYADPRPFYEVILNCNDVLKNFDLMKADHRISDSDYNLRYSDVGAVRTWVYLQLGIHYGSVPYVTDALENIDDIKDGTKFKQISFNELLTNLISFMTQLPGISSYAYPAGTSLNTTVDGYPTLKFFINREYLLGELYLWNGEYLNAATHYKAVMETETNNTDIDIRYRTFRVVYADVANNNDLAIGYIRYKEQDENSLVTDDTKGWKSIFVRTRDKLWNYEWIWALPFSASFRPENPFINLFSKTGGSYLLKPSASAVNNWNSQTQNNGIPYDARGLFSYTTENSDPVVMKYSYNYNSLYPLQKPGNWFLWRAAGLHLHFCEAANRDGKGKVAWALLNRGIIATYDTLNLSSPTLAELELMKTPDAAPYDFDARTSGSVSTTIRQPWYLSGGIRGRAYLPSIDVSYQNNMLGLEGKIIDEAALELAFEGYRWPDLLRIALRREKENAGSGISFLQQKMNAKFSTSGLAAPNMSNKEKWYLPFRWK